MSGINNGIIIGGNGYLKAKQLAVGPGATIEVVFGSDESPEQRALRQLRKELDDLMILVRKESAHLPSAAVNAVETVIKEVKNPEPNKLVVTSVLDSVAGLVTSFGGLSGAIVAVKELAAAVLK